MRQERVQTAAFQMNILTNNTVMTRPTNNSAIWRNCFAVWRPTCFPQSSQNDWASAVRPKQCGQDRFRPLPVFTMITRCARAIVRRPIAGVKMRLYNSPSQNPCPFFRFQNARPSEANTYRTITAGVLINCFSRRFASQVSRKC
jgi:hypothetical protein